jgi:hypothetical protein
VEITAPPAARTVTLSVDGRELTVPELEKTMRLTSICGLGQVALGPAISVLGLERGGTAARPQPRPARPADKTVGQTDGTPDESAGA